MLRDRQTKKLSPVLTNEPLVGNDLMRKLRVILISVVIAFVLTNFTSYLIGQAVRADADQDNRARIATLEREFAADLDERRRERDAEVAGQNAKLAQLRRDVCTLADRAQPRDDEVLQMRRRYGCTGPAVSGTAPGGPSTAGGGTPGSDGRSSGAPRPQPGPRGPSGPAGPPAPAPSPAPPPTGPSGGLPCSLLFGCPL